MIPIDEQIASQKHLIKNHSGHGFDIDEAILASLQRLKAIDAVQVPEEPEGWKYLRQCLSDDRHIACSHFEREAILHIDTLRDRLKRESADKAILTAAYESKKTLLKSCEIALCAAESKLAGLTGALEIANRSADDQMFQKREAERQLAETRRLLADVKVSISGHEITCNRFKCDCGADEIISRIDAAIKEQSYE